MKICISFLFTTTQHWPPLTADDHPSVDGNIRNSVMPRLTNTNKQKTQRRRCITNLQAKEVELDKLIFPPISRAKELITHKFTHFAKNLHKVMFGFFQNLGLLHLWRDDERILFCSSDQWDNSSDPLPEKMKSAEVWRPNTGRKLEKGPGALFFFF